MRIQHNIMAMNAYRNYNNNTKALSGNLEKLSSGYKINRAGDDAAGLAISEKMRAQITGLEAAQKNVKDGTSLVKTAEGAMQEIQDMLNRMDYLATQSANGTYDNEVDRLNLQKEVSALKSEINRIADSANFNGIKLLDGTAGYNADAFAISSVDQIEAQSGDVDVKSLLLNNANFHAYEPSSTTQTAPSFTLSFEGVSFKTAATGAGTQATVEVTFMGHKVSVTVNSSVTNGTSFATAFVSAFNAGNVKTASGGSVSLTSVSSGSSSVSTIAFGGMQFAVTVSGSTVKFEAIGLSKAGGSVVTMTSGSQTTSIDFTEAQAKAVNDVMNGKVEIKDTSVNTTTNPVGDAQFVDGRDIHDVQVTRAVAKTPAKNPGVDFKLDTSFIADGGVINIDGTKIGIQTGDTAPQKYVDDSTSVNAAVDLSKEYKDYQNGSLTKEQFLNAAAQKITAAVSQTTNFNLSVAKDGAIHIDAKSTVTTCTYATPEEFAAKNANDTNMKVNAYGVKKDAESAKTIIDISSDKIADGSQLTVGEHTFTFVKKATGAENEIVIDGTEASQLKNALNGKDAPNGGTYSVTIDPTKNRVTIANSDVSKEIGGVKGAGRGLTLQIGDTADSYNQLGVRIGDMHTSAMGSMDSNGKVTASIGDIDISNQEGAQEAVQVIRDAINYVSGVRGDLGAIQNRLDHTANNLSVMAENIQDAESTIRDTDVADEMMKYVKNNILVQSAQAMLAQANQVPQGVLQLLG